MIILTLETEHYHFLAAGKTMDEAEQTLRRATDYHAGQQGIPVNWVDHYDVESQEISAGECYRDGQLLYRNSAA